MSKYQKLKDIADSIDKELDKVSFSDPKVESILRRYWSLTEEMLSTIKELVTNKEFQSVKYRIFKVNYNNENSNAACDYKNRETGEYCDYVLEYQAKNKAHELNKKVENSDIEFWYRAIEE